MIELFYYRIKAGVLVLRSLSNFVGEGWGEVKSAPSLAEYQCHTITL